MNDNKKQIEKEENKILAFLKENILIVIWSIVTWMIAIGFYFIKNSEVALYKELDTEINDMIDTIVTANSKLLDIQGKKINLFKDNKKINKYQVILDKFIKTFWQDSIKIKISQRSALLSKIFLDNKDHSEEVEKFIYWLLANWYKAEVMSYPTLSNPKFTIQIR